MNRDICRAFTFINYHIPLTEDMGIKPDYATIGFFDGLFTEELSINYKDNNLRACWEYIINTTKKCQGKFSYQNVFGISNDIWNDCTDEGFWKEETDIILPLTFVVFLQVEDYLVADNTFQKKCMEFNGFLRSNLPPGSMSYIYGSIDKNDFIVCIKSQKHKEVLNAIKNLHSLGVHIVYSYSTLSIKQKVLDAIAEDDICYEYMKNEIIDSICLKGITNSNIGKERIALDRKYCSLCAKLKKQFYGTESFVIITDDGNEENSEDNNIDEVFKEDDLCRVYDILGDNDFRFIAREVKLNKLLAQYSTNGLLSYYSDEYRFYLYSSSMILNTLDEQLPNISDKTIHDELNDLDKKFSSNKCNKLEERLLGICNLSNSERFDYDDNMRAIYQAVWQLIQSLKVLERSPVKQYDFNSLYSPFITLVDILKKTIDGEIEIDEEQLYEFVHKFSMTLNGIMRTDIQFFQVQDFNAIVHYAPAKLRAFYSMWAFELSSFYRGLNQEVLRNYLFILSPGLFDKISVEWLRPKTSIKRNNIEEKTEQLMLIRVPERNLYSIKYMITVLAHEVSHFVGVRARMRIERCNLLSDIIAFILTLEAKKMTYNKCEDLFGEFKHLGDNSSITNKTMYETLLKEVDRSCDEINDSDRILDSEETKKKIIHKFRGLDTKTVRYILSLEWSHFCDVWLHEKKRTDDNIITITEANREFLNNLSIMVYIYNNSIIDVVMKQISYVTKELFADVMAILTLELSPKEYLYTFQSETIPDRNSKTKASMSISEIRIAIVTETIKNLVEKNKNRVSLLGGEFYNEWRHGLNKTQIAKLKNHPQIHDLAVRVFGHNKGLIDYSENIEGYFPLYNDRNYISGMNYRVQFFKDKYINQSIQKYAEECGEYYLHKLETDFELRNQREKIIKFYKTAADGSATAVMQEIENFLFKYKNYE